MKKFYFVFLLVSFSFVNAGFGQVSQTIQLNLGWNIYSTYISPADNSVTSVFSPVVQDLIIVKDENGLVYWPGASLNTIGTLTVGKAYFIKMSSPQDITIYGNLVDGNTPLNLPSGWSLLGILKTAPVPVEQLLSPVLPDVWMVKDGGGHVYYPAWQLNQIVNVQPGSGYQLYMMNAGIISYLPILITTVVTNISQISALGGGVITTDGGNPITARGVCWNTSGNPTIYDNVTNDGVGAGTFTSNLTGLNPQINYFVRAYATNSAGTFYGNEVSFISFLNSCPGVGTVNDYDGNTYHSVLIGNQCWMLENMKTTHYSDGSSLVEGTDAGNISGDNTTKYWFDYPGFYTSNSLSYKDNYGLLYTWAAVMNGASTSNASPSGVQGICPSGWHVPSDAEMTTLTNFAGGVTVAGAKLKETGYEHWYYPNSGASNLFGFTAMPGGYRDMFGAYINANSYGYLWTSTESDTNNAWFRYTGFNYQNIYRSSFVKYAGFSVRCLLDYTTQTSQP
ncbi:MAG: fibrobacter succinogenes major paralogous domain-containing protein [Bacteroidia bacterium]|nr:fibrobacter succinogenes major paralogous domain-containing protein [Bacteroidia bacterium]